MLGLRYWEVRKGSQATLGSLVTASTCNLCEYQASIAAEKVCHTSRTILIISKRQARAATSKPKISAS
jgi:hypothetical protein